MCLGIAHVSGKVPLSGQGVWQTHSVSVPFRPTDSLGQKGQIHCVSTGPLVPREGLYEIHGQSLNTHRGKHRSGGAQVYRPVSQGFPVICYRIIQRKGAFSTGHRPGVPGTPGHPGGFQKFYVIFSYVPFLLPIIRI